MTAQTEENNQKKEEKKEKRSWIRIALIWYLILALLALFGTLGWFIANRNVYIQNGSEGNINLSVNTGELKIALEKDDGTCGPFGDRLNVTKSTKYYVDITSDGKTFYYPKTLDKDDQPYLNDVNTFVDVTQNGDFYVDFKVYFQTTTKMDVYLDNQSSVTSLEGMTNSAGSDAYSRKSMYGVFSCDAICGAARVAFLAPKEDGTLDLIRIWIPNDNIQLSYITNSDIADSGVPQAKLSLNGASEARSGKDGNLGYGYLALNSTRTAFEKHYYTKEDCLNGNILFLQNQLAGYDTTGTDTYAKVNQSVPLLSFEEEDTLQTKEMVIRLWFEGTDREADKALNGGIVNYNLSFIGIKKEEAPTLIPFEDIDDPSTFEVPEGSKVIYFNDTIVSNSNGRYVMGFCYFDKETYRTVDAERVGEGDLLYTYQNNCLDWTPYVHSVWSSTSTKNYDAHDENYGIFEWTREHALYIRLNETNTQKMSNIVKLTIPKLS